MMTRALLRLLFGLGLWACHGRTAAAPRAVEGPCDLVQAMLSIDNDGYQRMYAGAGCGGAPGEPLIVQVDAPGDLFPGETTCPNRSFTIFHGDPTLLGAILKLSVGPDGAQWHFVAQMTQPNMTPFPDGTLEDSDFYCHAIGGYVELRDGRWHTFHDFDRATRPRSK